MVSSEIIINLQMKEEWGNTLNCPEEISNLAREKLEVFKASIRDNGTYKDPIYKGAQSASQQISSDYGSRFLIELIQNAYDAHPPDRTDGRIKILLVREENEGELLYIANQGHGFLWGDVESLCSVGTSNKPIGQSVGNKGLGFRSVRYITDNPQVYSKSEMGLSEVFDGYCFRFARGGDFDGLFQEGHHRELAKKDIPFFHIPIPLTNQPAIVQKFAGEGFSTVIRLPLTNESALQSVIRLFADMRSQDVPLLLFLRRINSLEIIVDGDPEKSVSLSRDSKPLRFQGPRYDGDEYSCVNLGRGDKYFIAWHMIPEAKVKAVIRESIVQRQLHPSWEDWDGDGELAVAVKLNGDVISPRLYTYLPMGDQAKCPFHGYLHGSFYPKADRTNLNTSIPVNGLYIDEAARLCARTVLILRKMHGDAGGVFSQAERETAIVDLLAWNSSQGIEREEVAAAPILMRGAFRELGINFSESDILPIAPRKRGDDWGTPEEVWRWDQPDLRIFGADSLARIPQAAILSPKLGQQRLDRLEEFISNGDDNLTVNPTDMQLSHMAEMVAVQVLTPRSPRKAKTDYYLELEKVFKNRSVDLSKRKLLYCSDGMLRASESTEVENQVSTSDVGNMTSNPNRKRRRRTKAHTTIVFSPSRRSIGKAKDSKVQAEVLQVPMELQKNLAFLSDQLDWYGDLEAVRKFLEEKRLVRSYDAEDLIAHVSFLSRINRKNRMRQAALSWVFNLWLSYQNAPRSLALHNVNLLVPTLNGKWIDASQAIFSTGWPARTLGNITEEFLSQTGSYSDELMRVGEKLLAHKIVKPFKSSNIQNWADFLEAIGAKMGLQPSQIETKELNMWGSELTTENICSRFQIDGVTKQYWQRDVNECGEKPIYRNSPHKLEGGFWCFPGQEEHDSFSEDAKLHYSRLLLNWLENADSKHFEVILFSPSAIHASRFSWPTPLAAFMRHASWFPVEIQEAMNMRRLFLKPSEVWIPKEDESYRWPPYMPNIPREIRQRISVTPTFDKLVKWCNINVLNDPGSLSKQVWYLGKLYKEGRVAPYHFAAFLNLYNDAWSKLAGEDATTEELVDSAERYLITQQDNHYTYVDTTSEDQNRTEKQIYVRDSENNLGLDLVLKQGAHLFDPGPQDAARIAKLLRNILGERFKAVSDIRITLVVEGKEYVPDEADEAFAVNICPWLTHVVTLSMESLKGPAAQRLPVDRSIVISRLHNIRIRKARSVQYKVGNTYIPLTNTIYGAIGLGDIRNPLLIIQSDTEDLDWDALANASSQLSQLVRQMDLANLLKICFRKLQSLRESATGPINDYSQGINELCSELEIDRTRAEKALEGLSNNIIRLGRFLRPIIYHFKGIEASKQFADEVNQSKTLHDLIETLEAHLEGTSLSPENLVNICQRATGFDNIQDALKLPFGPFNRSLIAVGENPVIYPDTHVAAAHSFVAEHKDTIMDCLRDRFKDQFKIGQSLQDYIRCKEELETLAPRKEWLIDFRVPETSMIEQLVNDWLVHNGAPEMNAAPNLLHAWSEVGIDNKSRIKKLVYSHLNTVKAWCYKQGIEPPEIWNDIAVSDSICNTLHDLGALDFVLLEEEDLVSWLVIANIWPKGMPPTTELAELGLNEQDIEEESNRERAAKLRQEKEARSIIFNGRKIDPQEADVEKLAEELRNRLSKSIKAITLGNIANLRIMPESKKKRGPSEKHRRGGGGRKIPQEKTDLIGFLGECAVYYWLRKLQPQKDIDAAWVSGYRERVLPGAGDDSLGCDFQITYRNQPWYLEVKSSLGDTQEFELGDTEIRMARDCATKKGRQYRIIYVSNILDSTAMRLEVLPNPLSEEGKTLFRIGGQGIHYQFLRKT